ncbi:unnamed protein product, partial [marine sediment metagenome]
IIIGAIIGTVIGVAVVAIIIVVIIKKKKSREAVEPLLPKKEMHEEIVKEAKKYCPMCGTSTSLDTIFCVNCGEKFPR